MYKRILIVVEANPVSRAAVAEGTALARAEGAEVLFFSVLPRYTMPFADMPMFAEVTPQQFDREARLGVDRMLAAATVAADKLGVKSRSACSAGEDDAAVIVEAARRRRCDLIVVATEGRNAVLRLLTGSVVPGLITAATVPVLVVRPRPASGPARPAVKAKALQRTGAAAGRKHAPARAAVRKHAAP